MHGNFYFEIRVEGLKCCGVTGVIDGVEPNLFRELLLLEHWRVVRRIDGSETRRKSTHSLVAVNLQIEDSHRERVAGLGSFDEEWPGKGVVTFRHRGRVAGLLNAVAKAIERICFEDVSGPQTCHRRSDAEDVLHVVEGAFVVNDIRRGSSRRILGGSSHRETGHQ